MLRKFSSTPAIQKSLDISWREGIAAAIMLAILDYYLVPYALFLGATTQQIGFLVAIPNFVASIAQLLSVRVVRMAGSRLRFLVRAALLQALILVPTALLTIYAGRLRVQLLVLFVIIFRIFGNLIATAWGSLVSDYLPSERRGRYLGWRSQVTGFASVLTICFAGVLLYAGRKFSFHYGFLVLYLAAASFRLLSMNLMSRMLDLPVKVTPESDFTFLMFIRRFKESNFVRFVLYVASITFATNLASPYFSVYMLRELHFDYLSFMFVTLSAVVSMLVAFPIWGRHADVVGNASVLKITSFLIPAIPLLWLVSRHVIYLGFAEMFAGFVWCGFNLCATNFIFDAVVPEKRVRCLGYFNLINGSALFLGASLGGYWAERLPPLLGHSFYTLFILSAGARFLAHFFLSPSFKEVRVSARHVKSLPLFFSVVGIRPIAGEQDEWGVFASKEPS